MSASGISLVDFQGMVTAPGLLARAKASFTESRNVLFSAPGLIEKRRGFRRMPGNAGAPIWKLLTSDALGANVLAHVGTPSPTNFRFGDGSGAFTALPTIDAGALTRTRGQRTELALSQRNHYLTTTEGVARLESDIGSSDIRYAGMPKGLGVLNPILSASGSNIADGFARAYRGTIHRLDADEAELGGAPTARWIVSNRSGVTGGYTGAARAADFSVMLPREWGTLATALDPDVYFLKLWGNRTYDEANGQVGDDEMYLISQTTITAAMIALGYVNLVDSTPDDYLLTSPRLHTNGLNFPPVEAGIRQGTVNADDPPPVAETIATWMDVVWYGNLTTRPLISLALIAALADGDTIVIRNNGATLTFTARNVPAAPGDFQIFTTAPTLALNIRETVRALMVAMDALTDGYTNFQTATATSQPGAFLVEQCRTDVGFLSISVGQPAKWLSLSSYDLGTAPQLTPATITNGLAFSKPARADAVPPINSFNVGPGDCTLLKVQPYQQRLLCFTDRGIYQVTGRTYADFSVFPFDESFRLISSSMVAVCDEKVYAWCFEGIVEIDSSGVRVISPPIEPSIEQALVQCGGGPSAATSTTKLGWNCLADLGFAVAYRMAHEVRFHFPQSDDPTNLNGCNEWFSYDTRTQAWTTGRFPATTYNGFRDSRSCGVVRLIDDLLAMGSWSAGADTFLFLERREYDPLDYNDTNRSGTDVPIPSVVTIQFQIPDAKGSQHWQQSVFNWDSGEFSWRTLPTSVDVAIETDNDGVSMGTILTPVALTRFEPPRRVRRGQRFRISITHALAEYMGVVGIDQSFDSGSRFGRTVTP